MDLPARIDHPSFRTALATTVAGTLLLLTITLVLFVLPALLVSAL